jgi:tetratricopeptide (TPR) repeat protein
MAMNDAVALVRGTPGTSLTLTVISAGNQNEHEVTLTREASATLAAVQRAEAGNELLTKKLWPEAEAQYREAIRIDPSQAWFHGQLGWTLYQQRKYAEAEAACREALRLDPKVVGYHSLLALAIYATRNINADPVREFAESEAEAREAVRLDPKSAAMHNVLGIVLLVQKKWVEAESEFNESVRLDPSTADFKNNVEKARKHQRF